ncbi:2-dehydro-3-deoxygalactonokinase [Frigidibacter sp. MR17.24]|uniref:2-dehydro-3-deoxygalactonokinase n=1 Tax=Frigidibacter sp. MR17.24 TaxID=3127345 RepID=UPI003012A888
MTDLIALDWGTSSLRAFLMRDAQVVEERSSPHGIQKLPEPGGEEGYRAAFTQICGDWAALGLPAVAGGMVGSQQGWIEAPYVRCPAAVTDLVRSEGLVDTPQGGQLHIVPGVLLDDPALPPDVIRGEEIQIAGALADRPDWARAALFVMPGTHSKWVTVRDSVIETFSTYMTGEIFAVMADHSILGRLMTDDAPAADVAADAFAKGIEVARAGGAGDLGHQLFSTRTMGLTKRLPNNALRDYLSGLLIGNEILSAARALEGRAAAAILMIGEGRLCDRYRDAMAMFGLTVTAQLGNTAPQGLWRFAETRGLVAPASQPSLA